MAKPKVKYNDLNKKSESVFEKLKKLLTKKPLCVNDISKKLNVSQSYASILCKKYYNKSILTRKKIKNYVFYGLKK